MTEWWGWDRFGGFNIQAIPRVTQGNDDYYLPYHQNGRVSTTSFNFFLDWQIQSTRVDGTLIGNRTISIGEVLHSSTNESWSLPPIEGDGFTWYLTISLNFSTPGVARFLVTALAIDVSDSTLPIVAKGFYYLPTGIGRHALGTWDRYLGTGIVKGAYSMAGRCVLVVVDDLAGDVHLLDMRRNSTSVDFAISTFSISDPLGVNEIIGCTRYGSNGIWIGGTFDEMSKAHRFTIGGFGVVEHSSYSLSSSYRAIHDTTFGWYQSALRPWTWYWNGPFLPNPAYPYDSNPFQSNMRNVTRCHMEGSAYDSVSGLGATLCFRVTQTTATSITGQICALVIDYAGNVEFSWDITEVTHLFYDDQPIPPIPDWITQAPWLWHELWRGTFLAYGGIAIRTDMDDQLDIVAVIHLRDQEFTYNPDWGGENTQLKYRAYTGNTYPPNVYSYLNGNLLFPGSFGNRIFADRRRIFVNGWVYGPHWDDAVVGSTRINQRDDHKTSGAPRLRVNGRGSSAQEASRSRAGGNTYS